MNKEAIEQKLKDYCEWCKAQGSDCQANLGGCSVSEALALLQKPYDLQTETGTWANRVFDKGQTITGIINHLIKEVYELRDSDSPDEAADCLLLLCQHAHECGYDLIEEAWKKHKINLERKWGKPDEHGVIEHIREQPSAEETCDDCGMKGSGCGEGGKCNDYVYAPKPKPHPVTAELDQMVEEIAEYLQTEATAEDVERVYDICGGREP